VLRSNGFVRDGSEAFGGVENRVAKNVTKEKTANERKRWADQSEKIHPLGRKGTVKTRTPPLKKRNPARKSKGEIGGGSERKK